MVEQKSLSCTVEIAGLPDIPPKEIYQTLKKIASKLNMDSSDVQSSTRLPGSKAKSGPILVGMKSDAERSRWI